MSKQKQLFEVMRGLTYLTQLGLSICIPIVLCIWGASWLQNRFHLGGWIVLVGIVLGLGGGASSLWGFIKAANRQSQKKDKH